MVFQRTTSDLSFLKLFLLTARCFVAEKLCTGDIEATCNGTVLFYQKHCCPSKENSHGVPQQSGSHLL